MTALRYARCKARRNVLPALSGLPDQGAPLWSHFSPRSTNVLCSLVLTFVADVKSRYRSMAGKKWHLLVTYTFCTKKPSYHTFAPDIVIFFIITYFNSFQVVEQNIFRRSKLSESILKKFLDFFSLTSSNQSGSRNRENTKRQKQRQNGRVAFRAGSLYWS